MNLNPVVPSIRVNRVNDRPLRSDGTYVLYWMIAQRRTRSNFALQHAVAHSRALKKPLVVLEALRCGARWSAQRFHAFVLDGMEVNGREFEAANVRYLPYVEPEGGAGRGLLQALAERACVVVTDEFPCFFLPRMVTAAGKQLDVRLEQVDANGIVPLRAADREYTTAYSFRRFLHKTLPDHWRDWPMNRPLDAYRCKETATIPRAVLERWKAPSRSILQGDRSAFLESLPIADIAPTSELGGSEAGDARATAFLDDALATYGEGRNHPDDGSASGLSPYLHFGHVSSHAVVGELLRREGWEAPEDAPKATGKREGWWGLSAPAEAFLDELITWREVGYIFTHQRADDYDQFESLPGWAQKTLEKHAGDPREVTLDVEELAAAHSPDDLWNAAQRQLVREGRMHNYLRMLWGKRILEWTRHPREAADVLIELNNRYALDGRNPNSYSGIFWTLGRFDRAWGPERPIFGTVRYMSSANTRKKVRLKKYLQRYSAFASDHR